MVANCSVKSVDTKGMKFMCNSQSYGVSTGTSFNLGAAGTSFAGLKVGLTVTVTYQMSGSAVVAESVSAP